MTEADLYAFLSKHKLGIFASISGAAVPQSALVGIAVTPQLEIIFDTTKDSRKYPNLIARPACSFVIGGWGTGEQTVQYEGIAEELKPPALARYQETYFAAWPDGPARTELARNRLHRRTSHVDSLQRLRSAPSANPRIHFSLRLFVDARHIVLGTNAWLLVH